MKQLFLLVLFSLPLLGMQEAPKASERPVRQLGIIDGLIIGQAHSIGSPEVAAKVTDFVVEHGWVMFLAASFSKDKK